MDAYLMIHFINGSVEATKTFPSVADARRYAREHISYSGGRVDSVMLVCADGSRETLWRHTWDNASKSAGLADCE